MMPNALSRFRLMLPVALGLFLTAVLPVQAQEPVRVRNPAAVRPWQHVLSPLSGYLRLAEELWRGGKLKHAIELRDEGRLLLSGAEASFLDAADAAQRAEVEAVAAEGRRKLARAEQALARDERREARMLAEEAEVDARLAWALAENERSRRP